MFHIMMNRKTRKLVMSVKKWNEDKIRQSNYCKYAFFVMFLSNSLLQLN